MNKENWSSQEILEALLAQKAVTTDAMVKILNESIANQRELAALKAMEILKKMQQADEFRRTLKEAYPLGSLWDTSILPPTAMLIETRREMLRHIIEDWTPAIDEKSKSVFDFIRATISGEIGAEKRAWTQLLDAEVNMVVDVVRKHLTDYHRLVLPPSSVPSSFTKEVLTKWIRVIVPTSEEKPRISMGDGYLLMTLGIARTRTGGCTGIIESIEKEEALTRLGFLAHNAVTVVA